MPNANAISSSAGTTISGAVGEIDAPETRMIAAAGSG